MSPRSISVMTGNNMGFFDDVYHLYTYTTEFFGDSTIAAEAGVGSRSGSGSGSGATTPQVKPSSDHDSRRKFYCDTRRKSIVHILRTWERTALHQYADHEVRAQLVRDLRRLYEFLDGLFFEGMLWMKYREHDFDHQKMPCDRVRLDIFESMPSTWCGRLRRYLGVRRHAFSSGSGGYGNGGTKRCHGLRRGGVGHGCCGGSGYGSRKGAKEEKQEGEDVVGYDEHPGATVWTSLLCRSAKSLRRRRRLRIALVLRSPDDGGHYSIEHLLRALVHEMCHAYIEKVWGPGWPDADYEAFVRGNDGHGVLWQALCWKAFEEIESWGVDSAQGLRRQEPMLADLSLNRTGALRIPEATEAIFKSLGPGLV
ncbi:hypothetical protein PG993_009920 [Apiospora rasikravindrae]|uniref:SprT-like domain-containing protein n=1 Tax=Apiospora rasikravindrae TaxID=990691 RepID=A0ABR1SMI6_9PEZI